MFVECPSKEHVLFVFQWLAGPRGLSAPRLSSTSGRTVVIEWDPPSVPNGILQKYLIQRRVVRSDNPSDVAEVNASLPRRYVDNTARPITTYQYRIIAYNSGPGAPSPYSNVTTGEGGKTDSGLGQRVACAGTPSCQRSPSSDKPITRPTHLILIYIP